MCNKKKLYYKIKAREMKPGMVINTRPKDKDPYGICLVTACSGYTNVEYTHFNYNDSYGGRMVGTIDGKEKVTILEGDERKAVLKKIKEDIFKWLHRANENVDLIRLIEAMGG